MQNVARAIELIDNAVECYFTGTGMAMSRYYNPYTGNRSSELGSVWMYTSSIEAVNAAMKAMKTGQAKGETALYDSHFNRYKELLTQLYDNLFPNGPKRWRCACAAKPTQARRRRYFWSFRPQHLPGNGG